MITNNLNKIAGWRNMLGLSQKEMATALKIKSQQQYSLKENGKAPFRDEEKKLFKELLIPHFPDITIDEIFF